MEFRLIYDGELPAEKCRSAEEILSGSNPSRKAAAKHRLRKRFHLQLRELARQDPTCGKSNLPCPEIRWLSGTYTRLPTITYDATGISSCVETDSECRLTLRSWEGCP